MAGNKSKKRVSAGLRKTLLSKTPLTIRYTEDQEQALKLRPHLHLEEFTNNNGTDRGWWTLCFRLNTGKELAVLFKNSEALEAINTGLDALEQIRLRYDCNQLWRLTEAEFKLIGPCLDVINEMQEKSTRREQLIVHRKINVLMEQYD